jgi:hypothetical protein
MDILKTATLSTGEILTIYKGRGRHLFEAQQKAKDTSEILWALITELIEIDGKKIVMEDLFDMDLGKVLQIQILFAEAYGNFLSLPQQVLSAFQNIQDGQSQSSRQ